MKKLTIMMATAALCCCLGSCNSGTKQELANTVHLKGQLLDMGTAYSPAVHWSAAKLPRCRASIRKMNTMLPVLPLGS